MSARRAAAFARASCFGLALASCAIDVTLGEGRGGVGGEACGDGLDNDRDGLVDEGCPPRDCRLPMDAKGVGACDQTLGFAWDGKQCVELRGCACLGSRCLSLYNTYPGCQIDKTLCESPGDVELCGDGIDNNGDGFVDEDCPSVCPPVARDLGAQPPEACDEPKLLGYAWDGNACVSVQGCGCTGPGCQALSADLESCLAKNRQCLPSTCVPQMPLPTPDGGGGAPGPTVKYKSYNPDECKTLGQLPCGPGGQFFLNECGCGCVELPPPDPNVPSVTALYASYDRAECEARKVLCSSPSGRVEPFFDQSGCGCLYKAECPDPNAPGVELIGKDPEQCQLMTIECKAPEFIAFRGPCGCGCMPAGGLCAMPADAYVSTDPYVCGSSNISCPNGPAFRDLCGCGCLPEPPDPSVKCFDQSEPWVDYLSAMPGNRAVCSLLSYECPLGEEPFTDPACGCGCRAAGGVDQPPPDDPAPGPATGL